MSAKMTLNPSQTLPAVSIAVPGVFFFCFGGGGVPYKMLNLQTATDTKGILSQDDPDPSPTLNSKALTLNLEPKPNPTPLVLSMLSESLHSRLLGCQESGFVPWRFGHALICVAAACDTVSAPHWCTRMTVDSCRQASHKATRCISWQACPDPREDLKM